MKLEHGSWFEHVLLFLGAWLLISISIVVSVLLVEWIYKLLHPDDKD